MKLTIELVPSSSWYNNVRSNVSKKEWDKLRRNCYKQSNYRCEICDGIGDKHPVECHEIWEYNDINKIQILKGLIALCPNCHKCKHPGLAQIKGEFDIVIAHLSKVNNITKKEAINYINKCFIVWKERSQYNWKLDVNYLN